MDSSGLREFKRCLVCLNITLSSTCSKCNYNNWLDISLFTIYFLKWILGDSGKSKSIWNLINKTVKIKETIFENNEGKSIIIDWFLLIYI